MSTQIKYNSIDPFDGIGPVPLVGRGIEYLSQGQERKGLVDSLQLVGQITGLNCYTMAELVAQQNLLIQRFSKDFQSFQIFDEGNLIYSKPFTVIDGITFNESKYYNYLEYTINLHCYPEADFGEYFGVLNPVHELSFTENPDGTVDITNTVSAKGFNTSAGNSDALNRAAQWCRNYTGSVAWVAPKFLPSPGATPTLLGVSENINRLTAQYSVVEKYRYDTGNSALGILRYRSTYNSGLNEGLSTVSLQGDLEGARNQTLAALRTVYTSTNFYNIAESHYKQVVGAAGLNVEYLTSGVTEDSLNKKINFNLVWDDSTRPTISFDYSSTINQDYISDIATFNFEGSIKGRGDQLTRFNRVSGYYSTLNIFNTVNTAYQTYGLSYPLNPKAIFSGVTFNSFAGEIGINLQMNNRATPPDGFDRLDLTINVNPAIGKYAAEPLIENIDEGYYVTDLGYHRRLGLTIDGEAQVSASITAEAGLATLKTILQGIRDAYLGGTRKLLERNSFTLGNTNNSRLIGFSVGWSDEEGAAFTIP